MMRLYSFQKYIVCYGCKVVIHFMATTISTNFPLFPSMLAPFSQILNHIWQQIASTYLQLQFVIYPVDNFGTVIGENPDCLLLSGTVVGKNPDHDCWEC